MSDKITRSHDVFFIIHEIIQEAHSRCIYYKLFTNIIKLRSGLFCGF